MTCPLVFYSPHRFSIWDLSWGFVQDISNIYFGLLAIVLLPKLTYIWDHCQKTKQWSRTNFAAVFFWSPFKIFSYSSFFVILSTLQNNKLLTNWSIPTTLYSYHNVSLDDVLWVSFSKYRQHLSGVLWVIQHSFLSPNIGNTLMSILGTLRKFFVGWRWNNRYRTSRENTKT